MIETNVIPQSQPADRPAAAGCLAELGWFFSGAVLPIGSIAFYRKAARKSVGSAILFFVLFTLVLSVVATISFGVTMFTVVGGIQDAYAEGNVPVITISGGIAEVDGQQPFIVFDEMGSSGRLLVATDTSGQLTEIDRNTYDQGFLLTRTDLHVLNQQGEYQVLPLSELHTMFDKDPIVIDSETVSQAWQSLSAVMIILAFIGLVLWHTVVRLMILMLFALVAWGIISLLKPKTSFSPAIITGLYAVVPAVYLSYLFSRAGMSFPGLQTAFLVIFWAFGLVASLVDTKFFSAERPLRLWTALLGLPMLILFLVDSIWEIPSPGGPVALWAVALFTGFVVIGLRLFFRFKDQAPAQTLDGLQPPSTAPASSGVEDSPSSQDQPPA